MKDIEQSHNMYQVIVDLMGFLIFLLVHQSLAESK